MTKLLKNWWGRFLFQGRGILPTKRLLGIYLIVSSILFIISLFAPISWIFVIALNVLIFVASLIDLLFSPKRKELSFRRKMEEELERDLPYTIEIELNNQSEYALAYQLKDGIPQSFKSEALIRGVAEREAVTKIAYDVRAPIRGNYKIEKLYFRYTSQLGLWEKQMTVDLPQDVKVIPDLTETKQYLENAQKYLLYEGSKIRRQKRGAGDFAQIRNYVIGDDPRMINWRQTAKLRELMTNEYEPEHGKYITILIDCGRMMGAELEKGNRLEKALEAALTVTVAALQKGDYVSVLAFSKDVKAFVPPAKGMAHMQTILQAIYDLQVDAVESNYAAVLSYLETMQKKRSLLMLFSDVRTFLHEEGALAYLLKLRQRHLFFMIGVEDQVLMQRVKEAPEEVGDAMVKSIAQQQLLIKKREKVRWENQGLIMMEAKEENLATAAVSHYIDTMNRNLM